MTVCIAAACDGGRNCVTATDSLLSYAGITADIQADKRRWKGDWEFMYAGSPAHATLIFGELDEIVLSKPEAKERRYIQQSVSSAFQSFISKASSFSTLAPYDMSMKEFKEEGLRMFGQQLFQSLSEEIQRAASDIRDQILVVGWGHAPASVMISEVSRYGLLSHGQVGIAAIGSGAEVALSNMLLLGQSRNSTLAETIYNVAAAKFSSEQSSGLHVGRQTNIHISWKRRKDDTEGSVVGTFLDDEDLHSLRQVWEEHGRPKIPLQARITATRIAGKAAGTVSVRDMMEHLNASLRLEERVAEEDRDSQA